MPKQQRISYNIMSETSLCVYAAQKSKIMVMVKL